MLRSLLSSVYSFMKLCGYVLTVVGHWVMPTSRSAIAEGPREALVSRNPATTKHLT